VIGRIQGEGSPFFWQIRISNSAEKTSDRGYILEKGIVQYQGLMEEIWQNEDIVKKYLVV